MANWLPIDNVTACVFAGACAFLGLVGLLLCAGARRKRLVRLEVGLFVLVAGLGLGGLLVGAPAMLWLPCLGAALSGLLLVALRFISLDRIGLWVQTVLRRPAVLWLGLFLVGVGTLIAQRLDLEQQLAPDCTLAFEGPSAEELLQPVDTQWAVTDSGRMVPLFTIPLETSYMAEGDTEFMQRNLGLAMIRTEEVDIRYNCHGFVFADGRYWVRGAAVEGILQDNGYKETSTPQVGDVVVYRAAESKDVAHSGLVCSVLTSGVILIESKLGSCGRYLHTSDKHPYPETTVTYYHTRRGGHVLSGLDGLRRPVDTIAAE